MLIVTIGTSSRIHCDGYTDATLKPKKKQIHRPSEVLPLLLPKYEAARVEKRYDPPAAPKQISLKPLKTWKESEGAAQLLLEPWMIRQFDSEQEDRYFRVFYEKFASQISGYYSKSDVWGSLMLQASEGDAAIRHAIMAVGALNITLETMLLSKSEGTTLTSNSSNNEHHRFALQRYGKAIQELRTAISTPGYSLRNVLLASLLIICFENLHGNHAAAVTQMQSCLSLLRERVRRPALISTEEPTPILSPIKFSSSSPLSTTQSSGRSTTSISPIAEYIEGDLVRAFGRMDMQFMSFDYHRMSRDFDDKIVNDDPNVIPSNFSSVTEAQVYYERLARNTMLFLSSLFPPPNRPLSASSIQNPAGRPNKVGSILNKFIPEMRGFNFTEKQYGQVQTYKNLYVKFSRALQPLIDSLRPLPPTNPLLHGALVIRVWFLVANILLNCALTPLQTAFDAFQQDMAEIVTISKLLIQRKDIFTFDVGFILQLWVVGLRCRDRTIRGEAINLLLSRPWREGVWDSWLAGTMAKCVMEVEEGGRVLVEEGGAQGIGSGIGIKMGSDAKGIPEQARVKAITPKFDMKERRGTLKCFLPGDPNSVGLRVVEKDLRW